jgi:hypothetical protein
MKTLILREDQYKHIVDEMAYPTSFNMEVFKSLPSFNKRILYCQQHLTRLSSGSSRIVYQIDNDKVLKLAKNQKGIAQNEQEYDPSLSQLGVAPNIYNESDLDNFTFLVSDYVLPAKEKDFEHVFGFDFYTFCSVLTWADSLFNGKRYRYSVPPMEDEDAIYLIENDADLDEFYQYVTNYQPPIGDMLRIQNYGIKCEDGRTKVVLLDSGLNQNIWDTYYKR